MIIKLFRFRLFIMLYLMQRYFQLILINILRAHFLLLFQLNMLRDHLPYQSKDNANERQLVRFIHSNLARSIMLYLINKLQKLLLLRLEKFLQKDILLNMKQAQQQYRQQNNTQLQPFKCIFLKMGHQMMMIMSSQYHPTNI